MRTSKLKAVIAVVLGLALFAACNAAVSFALEPYGSKSELTWSDYHKQQGVDTVIVGSSLVKAALDPNVLNEQCDMTAFNLASPSQMLEESFVAIRAAHEDQGVKRVIFGLSCTTLIGANAPAPQTAFLKECNKYRAPIESFLVANEMLWHYGSAKSADSINWMFPWVMNHCTFLPAEIKQNIENKLNQSDLVEAAEQLEEGWKYVGLGSGAQTKSMNPNSPSVRQYTDAQNDDEGEEGESVTETGVNPNRARTLTEICEYCKQNNIELIFISAPLPLYDVIDEESNYAPTMREAGEIVTGCGAKFYDFNYVTSDLFTRERGFFADNTHFNVTGGHAFSQAFARFFNEMESGQDVSHYFQTYDELKSSVDYIVALFAESHVDAQGLHVTCRAVTGPDVKVEYRLGLRREKKDKWDMVTEYSENPEITYVPERDGLLRLCVYARVVGSSSDYERYRTFMELN